ncbi:VOC family protein [Nitrospirillum iridis]|uniref:Catechol 2,3-dioxygenase-like lactoylglutathione lyase family enzyme n=1 Tax=Nitrospirillum iridis TaxID=765888 RepID=A0A7X0B2A4_9PROT|nr:VOC family protein [Nitrospirillum iridis]MBB6253086.1 catechol 2,3-dioxygenase-like lactoylglutathione lyase family enzyme [Nitrospirillum iridis]
MTASSRATGFDSHGRIKAGTVATATFDTSLADYRDTLGLTVLETGVVPDDLAQAWAAPAAAGARMALLAPVSGNGCFLRLVEAPPVPGYRPARSFGWAAFEITVADVFALHERLAGSGFTVIGPPKKVSGFNNFIPMQVVGRGGEILYLNQVLEDMADLDLPLAGSPVDVIFIAVLAASDHAQTLAFQRDKLGLEQGGTFSIPYGVINNAFGLPADHRSTLTMTKVGRLPVAEIDQYPEDAVARPRPPGGLAPGNAIISLGVDRLDRVAAPLLAPAAARPGPLYAGRRSACVAGPDGEIYELIEMGEVGDA